MRNALSDLCFWVQEEERGEVDNEPARVHTPLRTLFVGMITLVSPHNVTHAPSVRKRHPSSIDPSLYPAYVLPPLSGSFFFRFVCVCV